MDWSDFTLFGRSISANNLSYKHTNRWENLEVIWSTIPEGGACIVGACVWIDCLEDRHHCAALAEVPSKVCLLDCFLAGTRPWLVQRHLELTFSE